MFDIIFMSYQEPDADKHWKVLVDRFPWARRVHGVKGLVNAHIECAKISRTSMYWHVEGDTLVNEDFNFSYRPDKWNRDVVHVWRSYNAINGLTYGNNGIKLFPRDKVLALEGKKVTDFTTSVSDKFKAVQVVASTVIESDPFNTWKSAFRECVKLSSKVIQGQENEETEQRLNAWCTKGEEKEFGLFCIRGARSGRDFGHTNRTAPSLLAKINDFDWLQERFHMDEMNDTI